LRRHTRSSYSRCPSPLSRWAEHPHQHTFPTRRSSDLESLFHRIHLIVTVPGFGDQHHHHMRKVAPCHTQQFDHVVEAGTVRLTVDRKSTRLNSSHVKISYAVLCLKKRRGRVRRAGLSR